MRAIDLLGRQFGRLMVVGRVPSDGGSARWYCRCACGSGRELKIKSEHLRNDLIKSCGCYRRDCVKGENGRLWKGGKKVAWWRAQLKRKYDLDINSYDLMFESQKGICGICKRPPKTKKKLGVDHDHETGVIRGLLCDGCNLALGVFKNQELLTEAKNYLLRDKMSYLRRV